MIESILIKNVATFDSTGVRIENLKKVNFIYGTNGCGKTTISNFLHNPTDLKFTDCSTTWKNAIELKTLVYNKEFRERNFGKGKIGGIFTLGEATTEDIRVINEKIETQKLVKAEIIKKRETAVSQTKKQETIENNFKEDCWTKIYKKHEKNFKEAFT